MEATSAVVPPAVLLGMISAGDAFFDRQEDDIIRIYVCHKCSTDLKNCACSTPLPDSAPIWSRNRTRWNNGDGWNRRLVSYLKAKAAIREGAAVERFPDVAVRFPQELKDRERWIVRMADKTPYSALEGAPDYPIDPHDTKYQADYETALGALDQTNKFSGMGYVFNYADGYTGVDFDHCVNPETLEINPKIVEIMKRLDSYAEFSPSRSGVHIITKGWQFPIDPATLKEGSKIGDAEMYSGKRYFTVTGHHVPGTPFTVNERDLGWLYERIVTNREFFVAKNKAAASGLPNESSCVVTLKKPGVISSKYDTLMRGTILRSKDTTGSSDFAIEDDAQILEYESQSSADYALLRCIAEHHNTEDAALVEEEFLKSPLGTRAKATRGDYVQRTITKLLKEPRLPFARKGVQIVDGSSEETGISVDRPKLNTEVGNARRLIEAYGKNIRYCPEDNCWLHFGGKVWIADRREVHVHDLMKRVLIGMQQETATLADQASPELLSKLNKDMSLKKINVPLSEPELANVQATGSKSKFKKVDVVLTPEESKLLDAFKTAKTSLNWARDSESSSRIHGSVEQARSEPGVIITKSVLDTDTLVCNVLNGAFRFSKDGGVQFGKHVREDYATKMMPVTYDPSADCPQFKAFLRWMFPEEGVQTYIQTYFGLCLTGLVVRKIVILYGEGANGKSTLMRVLYHLFGEVLDSNGAMLSGPYYQPVAFSTFAVGKDDTAGGARADLVPLKGVRLIVASESNKSSGKHAAKLDMARIKEFTGGDPTKARGLYQADEIKFTNQGKIILQTNHLPAINDDSNGAWDRLTPIKCGSRVEEKDQDENLPDKLIGEASGILNWLLAGLALYFQQGLIATDSMNDFKMEYRGTENHMSRFAADTCEFVATESIMVSNSIVYAAYQRWCGNNGEEAESQRALTQYLKSKCGVELKPMRDGRYLSKMRLRVAEGAEGVDLGLIVK